MEWRGCPAQPGLAGDQTVVQLLPLFGLGPKAWPPLLFPKPLLLIHSDIPEPPPLAKVSEGTGHQMCPNRQPVTNID